MDTKEKIWANFKHQCREYLATRGLVELRNYGRFLNLSRPTALNKSELIEEICEVLCGEKEPKRTKRGAPIKNKYFSGEIKTAIDEIATKYFCEKTQAQALQQAQASQQGKNVGEKESAILTFSIAVEQLNERQKQLLNDFLNSL